MSAAAQSVLIVDDVRLTAELARMMLDYYGFDTAVVYSGAEALAWLRINQVDAVLCDICMPGMSGVELAGKLNSHKSRPRLIAYTSYTELEEQRALLAAGFDAVLHKPTSADMLARALRGLN